MPIGNANDTPSDSRSVTTQGSPTRDATHDDDELATYTRDLTTVDDGLNGVGFRESRAWHAAIERFEARQALPLYAKATWARWLKDNRASARFDLVEAANKRRMDMRASVVRPIEDGCIGVRKATHTTKTESSTKLARRPTLLPPLALQHLSDTASVETREVVRRSSTTVPEATCIADAKRTKRMSVARAVHPVPITSRTYARLSKLPKPDTFIEGVSLVVSILDSHYRLQNTLADAERVKHSTAYRLAVRQKEMIDDMHQQRLDNLVLFLTFAQRPQHLVERGGPDPQTLVQLHDGFAECSRRDPLLQQQQHGGATTPGHCIHAEAGPFSVVADVNEGPRDVVAQSFLSFAATTLEDEAPRPTYASFLGAPLLDPTSSAATAFRALAPPAVLLTATAFQAACVETGIAPAALQHMRNGELLSSDGTTFLECLRRQFRGKKGIDEAVYALMDVGALPAPSWTHELFERYKSVGAVPNGSVGDRRANGGVTSSEGRRRTRDGAAGERRRSDATGRQRVQSTSTPMPFGAVVGGVSVDALTKLLRERGGEGQREARLNHAPVPAVDGTADGVDTGRRSPPLTASAAAMMATYDRDGDHVLSFCEFLRALMAEPSLHELGRW